MSYSNFLANTIKNSGYSLRDIASLCEKKCNVKITAAYLSKLQKEGNQNPASEKVNVAIAKVCKINPEDLLFEADLERAPESVKQVVETMVSFIKSMFIGIEPSITTKNEEERLEIQNKLDEYINMGTRQFIQMILQEDSNIDFSNPFSQDILLSDEEQNTIQDIFLKFSIGVKMLDNSMFPTIKEGAKLELVKLDTYNTGDIVSVEVEGKNLIRTYIDSGKNVTLLPINTDFEPITISKSKINISGKVKSYTIEL